MGYQPLLFGFFMAFIDVFILSMIKLRYDGVIHSNLILAIAFIIYGFQPIVFYWSMQYANLTNMNIIWDITSDMLVAFAGFYLFREVLTKKQELGIIMAILAIFLLK